ncbi:MAG: glycosyl hydrolase [Leptospiraceae bacterium]|nr:MAG: glycosyl hydrolase [Leptospiraceae bacterium]
MKFILRIIFILLPVYSIFPLEEWMYIYHPTLKDTYIIKQIKNYKILCITGFKIDKKGNIIQYVNLNSYNVIKNKEVYPLISLKNAYEGKIFLSNPIYRKNAIQNIIKLIKNDFSGAHIDFEYLTSKEAFDFRNFLKELQQEIRKINKKLTIAIFPPIWQMKYKEFHRLDFIYPYVDEVVLMTYDYHNPKTKPGPVSEYNWAKENIKEVLKYFKPYQIYLGIPLYGYEWEIHSRRYRIVDNRYFNFILYSKFPKKINKSYSYGTKIEYKNHNIQKILYYPDTSFREQLKNLAKEHQLKGVAYWRLGFEKINL